MADDDRDRRTGQGPRYTTPASGVRARTEPGVVRAALVIEGRGLEAPRRERNPDRDDTPVDIPLQDIANRISARTKSVEGNTLDTLTRVGRLEGGLSDSRKEVGYIAMQIVEVEGKVDGLSSNVELLVEESKEARKERIAREAAIEARAAAELAARERQAERDDLAAKEDRAFRRQRWIDMMKIFGPIIAALATIIAGLAGAFR